jgi:hypothetical protein
LDAEAVQVITIGQKLLESSVGTTPVPFESVGLQTPWSTLRARDGSNTKHEDRNDKSFHDRTGSAY